MDCRTHGNPQWLRPTDAKACKGTYPSDIRRFWFWGGCRSLEPENTYPPPHEKFLQMCLSGLSGGAT